MVATYAVNGGPAPPPPAHLFSRYDRLPGGDGIGQCRAQVKITLYAFMIRAIEPKHGPRVGKIDGVFELARSVKALGTEVLQVHGQGVQILESFHQSRRIPGALAFLAAVFHAGPEFLLVHEGMTDWKRANGRFWFRSAIKFHRRELP
jgi:hypothetical protein